MEQHRCGVPAPHDWQWCRKNSAFQTQSSHQGPRLLPALPGSPEVDTALLRHATPASPQGDHQVSCKCSVLGGFNQEHNCLQCLPAHKATQLNPWKSHLHRGFYTNLLFQLTKLYLQSCDFTFITGHFYLRPRAGFDLAESVLAWGRGVPTAVSLEKTKLKGC